MKTTMQRGYGAAHKRARQHWAVQVAAGMVACAKCGLPIPPGAAWDLGHTSDRTGYTGPEHRYCNRADGGRRGRRRQARRRLVAITADRW